MLLSPNRGAPVAPYVTLAEPYAEIITVQHFIENLLNIHRPFDNNLLLQWEDAPTW